MHGHCFLAQEVPSSFTSYTMGQRQNGRHSIAMGLDTCSSSPLDIYLRCTDELSSDLIAALAVASESLYALVLQISQMMHMPCFSPPDLTRDMFLIQLPRKLRQVSMLPNFRLFGAVRTRSY